MDLKNNLLKKILFFFIILIGLPSFSQNSLIEIKVSINVENELLEDVLKQIEYTYNIVFSYNSEIIPKNKKLSYQCENKPLKYVLTNFFGNDFYFKSAGQHIIILKKNNQEFANSHHNNSLTIKGIVVDTFSNTPLPMVTIFDMLSMKSTLTDSSGNFILNVNPKTTYLSLRCSKEGFVDNLKFINLNSSQNVKFTLQPNYIKINRLVRLQPALSERSDSISNIIFRTFVNRELIINSFNVFIADKRLAQISILPKISTNYRMGGSVINRFSINCLGGYSYGVAGFEAGGVVNINKKNVNGIQISCLINITGNNVNGFQASGLLNQTAGNVNGMQISCISNLGADTVNGFQAAGLINICKKSLNGMQLSPVINISRGKKTGIQIAGFLNYAPNPKFQFGLINIADTSNGAPLGVINIVKHGYYSIGLLTDNFLFTNLLFATGTHKLYSLLGVNARTNQQYKSWGICYGIGTKIFPNKKLGVNFELLSTVNTFARFYDYRTVSRLMLSSNLSLKLNKHLIVYSGPNFNTFISSAKNNEVDLFLQDFLPTSNMHYAPRNTQFDACLGGSLGIQYKF